MKRLFDTLITDLADRQVLGVVEGRGKENLKRRILLSNNSIAINSLATGGHHAY